VDLGYVLNLFHIDCVIQRKLFEVGKEAFKFKLTKMILLFDNVDR
jgi:hypothetical protein